MRLHQLALAGVAAMLLTAAVPAFADTSHAPPGVVHIGSLDIADGFARASLPGAPTAGAYVTITNRGTTPDTLVSVASPAAARVSLHTMNMNGDVMQMRALPGGIDIPAGATVAMTPSGLHMMLERPTQRLIEGETIALTLTFDKAGAVTITLPVLGIAAKGAAPAPTDHNDDHAAHEMEMSK